MIGRVVLFKDLPDEARYLFEDPEYDALLALKQSKQKGGGGGGGGSAENSGASSSLAAAVGLKPDPFAEYTTTKVRKGTAAAARLPRFVEFVERAHKTMEAVPASASTIEGEGRGAGAVGSWADGEMLRSTFEGLLEELDKEQGQRESGSDRVDMMKVLRFALFGGKVSFE